MGRNKGGGDDLRVPEARGLSFESAVLGLVRVHPRALHNSFAIAAHIPPGREELPRKALHAPVLLAKKRDKEKHGTPGQASGHKWGVTKELEQKNGKNRIPNKL